MTWATPTSRRAAPHREPAGRGEGGSATIWVLTASAGIVAVLLVITTLASIQESRQRAEAAADLAALAGASALARGGDACAAAGRVTAVNGGRLLHCTVAGDTVEVTASAPLPPALRRWATSGVAASARAGPADP